MGDSTLLPPSTGTFTPATPSGLTPNTRSEAEAALTMNSSAQTDSAAPTTPLPHHTKQLTSTTHTDYPNDNPDDTSPFATEAQKAYRRPAALRTSSTHYTEALHAARKESSVSSNFSTTSTDDTAPSQLLSSPVDLAAGATPTQFPAPGQGVVPLHSGVGAGQADAVRKMRPSGLNLGMLGRQQSWSEQDMKHVYTGHLLEKVEGDAGYSSGNEGRGVGA